MLNHHYEAILWAHSDNKNKKLPGGGVLLEVGLRTRIRMSIGTEGPAALQKEKLLKKLATINTNFSVSPDNLYVAGIAAGKSIDLKSDKRASFKVINQSDDSVSLKIKPVRTCPSPCPSVPTNTGSACLEPASPLASSARAAPVATLAKAAEVERPCLTTARIVRSRSHRAALL